MTKIGNYDIKIEYGMWMTMKPRAYSRKYWFDRSTDKHAMPMYPSERIQDFFTICELKMRKLYPNFYTIVKKQSNDCNAALQFTMASFEHLKYGHCEIATVCSIGDMFTKKRGYEAVMKKVKTVIEILDSSDPLSWSWNYNCVYIESLHKKKEE